MSFVIYGDFLYKNIIFHIIFLLIFCQESKNEMHVLCYENALININAVENPAAEAPLKSVTHTTLWLLEDDTMFWLFYRFPALNEGLLYNINIHIILSFMM